MILNTAAAKGLLVPSNDEIEAEKEKLRAEFMLAMSELRSSYENEQRNKEKIQADLEKCGAPQIFLSPLVE